jgi:hypothetical protein
VEPNGPCGECEPVEWRVPVYVSVAIVPKQTRNELPKAIPIRLSHSSALSQNNGAGSHGASQVSYHGASQVISQLLGLR